MASSKVPTTTLFSPHFVITAGCVLFRRTTQSLQVCLLFHETKKQWLLAKGRKDRGETIESAALRETYEETGYPCRLMPGLTMWTRAPPPGSQEKDMAALMKDASEPFAITMRTISPTDVKFTWWYIAEAIGPKQEGTQTESECFTSEFMDVTLALKKLTFATDREVVAKALSIINASNAQYANEMNGVGS